MDIDSLLTIALPFIGFVLIVGLTLLVYYYKYDKLPSTIEEFEDIIEDYNETKVFTDRLLDQVLAFFDPEAPMSVHPHVCREHTTAVGGAMQNIGSSPRV